MATEDLQFYRAILDRDVRYDGRFFFGVVTTGIYCRPICPAKPKKQNIRYYRSQTEAERAGFRPCLRCRPDLSPLSPLWRGTEAAVGRALNYIRQNPTSVQKLAERVGMTDRHLRRLFAKHLGAKPMEIALSNRLYLARQLLTESDMKIIDVAFASGFRSLRRFNDSFAQTYKLTPTQYRRKHGLPSPGSGVTLKVPYVGGFRFAELLEVLKNHEVYGIDRVNGECYERLIVTDSQVSVVRVQDLPEDKALKVEVLGNRLPDLQTILGGVRRLFDLGHNPDAIVFEKRIPKTIAERLRHTRVVGSFDPFETAIATILSQLVSTEQAKLKLKKLIELFGQQISNSPEPSLSWVFPRPEVLASSEIEQVGITRARAGAVRELSRLIALNKIDLLGLADFTELRNQLLEVKWIGPWTAEIIALRCFRDPDAFPKNDLIIARLLKQHGIDADKFAPWRAYMTCALWNLYVETKGDK